MAAPHLTRRVLHRLGAMCVLAVSTLRFAWARELNRPYEPLDPRKAQNLAPTPLVIQSGKQQHRFTVEVATTERERQIGLMHRNVLADDHGMLFDFLRESNEHFWMRNTFIPLDMIFIKEGGIILAIFADVAPHQEKPVGPNQPVRAVLELAGGTASRLGIKPGDMVRHVIFKNG